MSTDSLRRVSADDALATQDEWAVSADERQTSGSAADAMTVATGLPMPPTPEPYDEQTAHAAYARTVDDLDVIRDANARLGVDLVGALAYLEHPDRQDAGDGLDPVATLAALVAVVQDVRRELGQVEALIARAAGQVLRATGRREREGVLPDGRRYELHRGKDRKAWDHDRWQADVRRQVLSGVAPLLVDPTSGEQVDVSALLVGVEAAHGAGAPRVGVLKKQLGLDPDDYCETVPGPWTIRVHGDTPGDDDA